MAEGDTQRLLENLDRKFDDKFDELGKACHSIDKKAEAQGSILYTQDQHLERIEKHLAEINGSTRECQRELGKHETRLQLIEQAKNGKPISLERDWWKFLMVLAALAAGFGTQVVGKIA